MSQIQISILGMGGATGSRLHAGPKFGRAGPLDKTSVTLANAFQRLGRCCFPFHLTTSMSVDLFGLRRNICMRGAESNNWEFPPSREPPAVPDRYLLSLSGDRASEHL